jgi:hypothetical protein
VHEVFLGRLEVHLKRDISCIKLNEFIDYYTTWIFLHLQKDLRNLANFPEEHEKIYHYKKFVPQEV